MSRRGKAKKREAKKSARILRLEKNSPAKNWGTLFVRPDVLVVFFLIALLGGFVPWMFSLDNDQDPTDEPTFWVALVLAGIWAVLHYYVLSHFILCPKCGARAMSEGGSFFTDFFRRQSYMSTEKCRKSGFLRSEWRERSIEGLSAWQLRSSSLSRRRTQLEAIS